MSLSERIRPDIEAAPWVCEEVKKMDARIAELTALLKRLTQAFEITSDHFEEVQVDGEMIDPFDLLTEARAALAAVGEKKP